MKTKLYLRELCVHYAGEITVNYIKTPTIFSSSIILSRWIVQRKVFAKAGNTFSLCTGYWLPSYKLKISWATGLHLAVMYGHLESLSVLLNHKATINCRPNGKAAIHIACEMANVECLKILCNHGAKLNCFSMSGQAPLHFCTTRTSMPCAQQLLWRGKVKLWSIPPSMDKDGGHGLTFLLGENFSK